MIRAAAAALIAALLSQSALAADPPSMTANNCSVAGGRDVSGNTLNCMLGPSPEELKALVEAAAKGATAQQSAQIEDLGRRLGVTADATRTLLRIIGAQTDIPEERLNETLAKVATDYKRLQAQVSALDPDNATARTLVESAREAIAAGRFQAAHPLLAQARQAQIAAAEQARRLADQAQAARDAQLLGAAESAAAEGDLAMTELDYLQAAELFGQAQQLVPAGHPKELAGYLHSRAFALFRHGDVRGDNAALQQAIDAYRLARDQQPRERVPQDWAATTHDLGIALSELGLREAGTERLDEAIATLRAALQIRNPNAAPKAWAETEASLATALWWRGERDSETARLEEAVTAYRAVLDVPSDDAMQRAATQTSLGAVLLKIGERQGGVERLLEAVAVLEAALEVISRERAPRLWSGAQINLGAALMAIGERESGTARLERAVTAFDAALRGRAAGTRPAAMGDDPIEPMCRTDEHRRTAERHRAVAGRRRRLPQCARGMDA